jgi:hypothetical protein
MNDVELPRSEQLTSLFFWKCDLDARTSELAERYSDLRATLRQPWRIHKLEGLAAERENLSRAAERLSHADCWFYIGQRVRKAAGLLSIADFNRIDREGQS